MNIKRLPFESMLMQSLIALIIFIALIFTITVQAIIKAHDVDVPRARTPLHYTDDSTQIKFTLPHPERWYPIESKDTGPGWHLIEVVKILTPQDLDILSQTSITPARVKSAHNIGFVKIVVLRFIPELSDPKDTFDDEYALIRMHGGSTYHNDNNPDIIYNEEPDPTEVVFKGYKALVSTSTYSNSFYGTHSVDMTTSFIIDGVGYSVNYLGPEPLYKIYLNDVMEIIKSMEFPATLKQYSPKDGQIS
ncbi:MAG: hypothetical protein V4576_01090 [Patescibacteria group bacterium]